LSVPLPRFAGDERVRVGADVSVVRVASRNCCKWPARQGHGVGSLKS
jgi:hypothetical protein